MENSSLFFAKQPEMNERSEWVIQLGDLGNTASGKFCKLGPSQPWILPFCCFKNTNLKDWDSEN